jgi:hypothetical protein
VISQRKNNKNLILMLVFLGTFLLFSIPASSGSFRAYAAIPSPYASSSSQVVHVIQANVTFGQILRVLTPSTSNITILSLSGGQYDIGLYTSGTKNDVLFTPAQIENYTLVLNVSSTAANSAGFSLLGTPQTTWVKNVTGTGNLILHINVQVLPQPVSQSSGWNPLFGFTGISLGGITLDATEVVVIFALFSASLIIIGMKRSHKLLYIGLFFLSLIGMIELGILVVGVIIGSYVAGFLIIKSYFGFKSRRQTGGI